MKSTQNYDFNIVDDKKQLVRAFSVTAVDMDEAEHLAESELLEFKEGLSTELDASNE